MKLSELDYDVIERVINVNLYGTIHMAKAFLPHLMKRPVAHVANVSSMGRISPRPWSDHLRSIQGSSQADD